MCMLQSIFHLENTLEVILESDQGDHFTRISGYCILIEVKFQFKIRCIETVSSLIAAIK